jgi:hypothetical protein
LPLGVALAFAAVAPAFTQEGADQLSDPGRSWAESAGCDLSRDAVRMNVSTYDYIRAAPVGAGTVEEAVLGVWDELAEGGATFSSEDLREAAASTPRDVSPIEVRLPGAAITVEKTHDGTYIVAQVVQCAG